MTTLVAVRKHDQIAIAADSLTTLAMSASQATTTRASTRSSPTAATTSACADRLRTSVVFESLLASNADYDFRSRLSIFETLRKLHPILKDQHFLNPKEEEDDPYESTQITALIANENGIFGVYSMREVFEYTQFWAVGSGKEVALGAMYALYPRLETAADVARAGVEAGQCSIGTRRCR